MEIAPPRISGIQIFQNPVFRDLRGSFSEFWNGPSLAEGFSGFVPQSAATSVNTELHTLRGLHYQIAPYAQTKLVFCSHGAAYDVVLDLRPHSLTYRQWQSFELRPEFGRSILIPPGCAHGFVSLATNTVITYLIMGPYVPEASRIVRWNDPQFGITWPVEDPILSDRDRYAPDFLP